MPGSPSSSWSSSQRPSCARCSKTSSTGPRSRTGRRSSSRSRSQAMPFLVLGVSISAAIAAFVPPGFLPRLLPDRPALAVPVAAAAGAALPGCECGSVPIAGRLVARGVAGRRGSDLPPVGARDQPGRAGGDGGGVPRHARGRRRPAARQPARRDRRRAGVGAVRPRRACSTGPAGAHEPRGHALCASSSRTAQHDLLQAGGFLIIGAATAATLQTVVPRSVLDCGRRVRLARRTRLWPAWRS